MISAISCNQLRALISSPAEIALLDVRDKDDYLVGHILPALCVPSDQIEVLAPHLIPRLAVPLVIYDNDGDLVPDAAARLRRIGYTSVTTLDGGLPAWRAAGCEEFEDSNAPSKIFGEFVEHVCGTPSIDPHELLEKRASGRTVILLDCRPDAEHEFGHIPGALQVPGPDIADYVSANVTDPEAEIVIHCGGRTRGIIATQSVISAGVSRNVFCLRNGTMGWRLAGYELEFGRSRPNTWAMPSVQQSRTRSRIMAERFGVAEITTEHYRRWLDESQHRTMYVFDLRTSADFNSKTSGIVRFAGQIVQETDYFVGVRNARVVLLDDRGSRAVFVGAWLASMGWTETAWLPVDVNTAVSLPSYSSSAVPSAPTIDATTLYRRMQDPALVVIDLSWSGAYIAGHIKNAVFARRRHLSNHLSTFADKTVVLVSETDAVARWAFEDVKDSRGCELLVLEGGMLAWRAARYSTETRFGVVMDPTTLISKSLVAAPDELRRSLAEFVTWELERFFIADPSMTIEAAMQGYLDWEIELYDRWRADPLIPFALAQTASKLGA